MRFIIFAGIIISASLLCAQQQQPQRRLQTTPNAPSKQLQRQSPSRLPMQMAVASVVSSKSLGSSEGVEMFLLTMRLEKLAAGSSLPSEFVAMCPTKDKKSGIMPPLGRDYFTPNVGDRVFVILSGNGGDLLSYTPVNPRLIEAMEKNPSSILVRFGEAYVDDGNAKLLEDAREKIKERNFPAALAIVNKVFTVTNTMPEAYYTRGMLFENASDYKAAISDLSRAIELDNEYSDAFLLRGQCRAKQYDWIRAIQDFSKAMQIDPANKYPLFLRANAYRFAGDFQNAGRDFDEILKMDRNNFWAMKNKAMMTYQNAGNDEDLKKSALLLEKASLLQPSDVYCKIFLYIIRSKLKMEASGDLNAFAAANMKNATAWPLPVIMLFAGKITPEDLLISSENSDKKKNLEQKCEAFYYLGEYFLLKGDKARASEYFAKSVKTGVQSFSEYLLSSKFLKELNK